MQQREKISVGEIEWCSLYTERAIIIMTSSSAMAERPREASYVFD